MRETFYFVEPEVAGGLGPGTVLDTSVHPPLVSDLEYEFGGWLGDVLVESFPVFLLETSAAEELLRAGMTGFSLDEVNVTRSVEFDEMQPAVDLPNFVWLRVFGEAEVDDIAMGNDYRLVMSMRAVALIGRDKLRNALFESV